jgi:hypothetical protein
MERRDARSGDLLGTIPVVDDGVGSRATVGFGSVWKATSPDGMLTRINAETGDVQARISIPDGLDLGLFSQFGWAPALDERGVWVVTGKYPRSLVHVDAATNAVDRLLADPSPSGRPWSAARTAARRSPGSTRPPTLSWPSSR